MSQKKVTSNKNIDFPSLNWSIGRDEKKELPADKEAQKAILSNRHIISDDKKDSKESEELNKS